MRAGSCAPGNALATPAKFAPAVESSVATTERPSVALANEVLLIANVPSETFPTSQTGAMSAAPPPAAVKATCRRMWCGFPFTCSIWSKMVFIRESLGRHYDYTLFSAGQILFLQRELVNFFAAVSCLF